MHATNIHKLRIAAGLLSAAIFLGSVEGYAGGGFNGGGGYAVRCRDGLYYALDFKVLAASNSPDRRQAPEIVAAGNLKAALTAVRDRLIGKIPKMAGSLTDFIKFSEDILDKSTDRMWNFSDSKLNSLRNILGGVGDAADIWIPEDCTQPDGSVDLHQAVIRHRLGSKVHYEASKKVLEQLRKTSVVQESFLMVHEWLRDYTEDLIENPKQNALILQKVTGFMHSPRWHQISSEDMLNALRDYGLPMRDLTGELGREDKRLLEIQKAELRHITTACNNGLETKPDGLIRRVWAASNLEAKAYAECAAQQQGLLEKLRESVKASPPVFDHLVPEIDNLRYHLNAVTDFVSGK